VAPANAALYEMTTAAKGDVNHSNKFVIWETFGEVKKLTFGYNMNIIRK
jgi:hypothetical protein